MKACEERDPSLCNKVFIFLGEESLHMLEGTFPSWATPPMLAQLDAHGQRTKVYLVLPSHIHFLRVALALCQETLGYIRPLMGM